MLELKEAIRACGFRHSFGDEPFDLSQSHVAYPMNPLSSLWIRSRFQLR
jgi:hypothetical protein